MATIAQKISGGFEGKRIVVIGDPVADQFLRGTIGRVSREAPVFILKHEETETVPGGAANAAANIASLGADAVLIGVVADDANGDSLKAALESRGVDTGNLVTDRGGTTTTKVRVLAGQHYAQRQQVIRIDYEHDIAYSEDLYSELKERIAGLVEGSDGVIISDYSYGSATPEVGEWAEAVASEFEVPFFIDSRSRLESFRGGYATPNQEEAEQILGENFSAVACESLREKLDLPALLVTRGNKGMLLVEPGREPLEIPAVGSKEPVDVTGAGDTVIAAFALGIASGLSCAEAAAMANHAGGIVVMKRGTATASLDELKASLCSWS